jgi:fatty-acyl-CoA synthase
MAVSRSSATLIKLAVLIGLLGPVLVLAGALATKAGVIDWKTGFGVVALKWASWAAMAGIATGLLALFLARKDVGRWGLAAAVALVVPAITLGMFLKLKADAAALPPIHDVATDWENPLGFSRQVMDARRGSPNPIEADPVVPDRAGPPWAGRRIAEINAETCPGAKPILRAVSEDQVAEAFQAAGVQIRGRAPWKVEGTYESFWFGFQDDIVARIGPERTDFRSISRVGVSDLGANCARITKIVKALGG